MPFDAATLTQHPLSAAYPAMPDDDFLALVTDITRNGLREPITTLDGQVLDGWHRHQACIEAGVSGMYVEFDEGDPREFVISKNTHRRHLSASQRAGAVVRVAQWLPTGRPKKDEALAEREKGEAASPFSNAAMAKAAGTTVRTVQQVKRAVEAGLGDAVRDGKVSAEKAAEIAKAPPKVQKAAKAAIEKGEEPVLPKTSEKMSETEKLQIELEEYRERLADMARDLEVYMKVESAGGRTDGVIKGLMDQIRALETTRDTLMTENAQLKREVKNLRRKMGQNV